MGQNALRIAVGIATVGRPAILARTIELLFRQVRPADEILIGASSPDDATGLEPDPRVRLLLGRRGLPHQRNHILDEAGNCDVVVFFDDDFLPAPDWLAAIERVFLRDPAVVLATGHVLADGIIGPGLSFDEGLESLVEYDVSDTVEVDDIYNAYGCNMAVRLGPQRAAHIRFDERLPLYGWLEDVDFSRRMARLGRVVKVSDACGVHLGVKAGRQAGLRLGYSQIANPLYLAGKRTFQRRRAFTQMARNFGMNIFRSIRPEPYVDRRGRLAGNMLALADLLGGRLRPERILELAAHPGAKAGSPP
jgi:GT2 family glycosyltransferase